MPAALTLPGYRRGGAPSHCGEASRTAGCHGLPSAVTLTDQMDELEERMTPEHLFTMGEHQGTLKGDGEALGIESVGTWHIQFIYI